MNYKCPRKGGVAGRSKGGKGRASYVQCCKCGQLIPRDKAKKVTRYASLMDRTLAQELKSKGAIISRPKIETFYCISCAVHRGIVKVRSKAKRRTRNQY